MMLISNIAPDEIVQTLGTVLIWFSCFFLLWDPAGSNVRRTKVDFRSLGGAWVARGPGSYFLMSVKFVSGKCWLYSVLSVFKELNSARRDDWHGDKPTKTEQDVPRSTVQVKWWAVQPACLLTGESHVENLRAVEYAGLLLSRRKQWSWYLLWCD